MIIQLPCTHTFNNEAILNWLTEESCECPVCRYKLSSKKKKSIYLTNSSLINTNPNPIINQNNYISTTIYYYYHEY